MLRDYQLTNNDSAT